VTLQSGPEGSTLPDSRPDGDTIWHADHPSLQDEVQPLPIVEPEPEEIPEAPKTTIKAVLLVDEVIA
jgi:hypothetical protein